MSPPPQGALWRPVEHLADLDVVVSRLADGQVRVELVDRRTYVELVSLDPRDVATLAGLIAGASCEASRPGQAPGAGGPRDEALRPLSGDEASAGQSPATA